MIVFTVSPDRGISLILLIAFVAFLVVGFIINDKTAYRRHKRRLRREEREERECKKRMWERINKNRENNGYEKLTPKIKD